MADQPQDFTINRVNVSEQPAFDGINSAGRKTLVTFYVGNHGPFQLKYDGKLPDSYTVQADMDAQVLALRTLCTPRK